jgi:hypothetical protein
MDTIEEKPLDAVLLDGALRGSRWTRSRRH